MIMVDPNDPTASGTVEDPTAGGSASADASGTVAGDPAGGSVDPAALNQEIERLRAENERKDHQIRQHLSEKTNTEAARREAERIIAERDAGRAKAEHLTKLRNDLYSGSAEEQIAAAAQLIPLLAGEVVQVKNENAKLKEMITTPIPDTVPADVRKAAMERLDAGLAASLDDALNQEIGARVRAGTWTPAAAPQPKPGEGAVKPAAAAGTVRPQPVATRVVSAPDAGGPLPDSLKESEYLALTGPRFAEAYRRRKAGSLSVVPG